MNGGTVPNDAWIARHHTEREALDLARRLVCDCRAVDCPRRAEFDRAIRDHDAALVAQARSDALAPVLALADDWEANGNSRELGDPTDRVWFKCAAALRAAASSHPTGNQP